MMRFDIHEVMISVASEIDGALAAIAKEGADAVIIQGSLPPKMALDAALKYRLAAFASQRTFAEMGALATYSSSFVERAAGLRAIWTSC